MKKKLIKKITMAGALSLSMILSSGALTACSNNSIKTAETTKKKTTVGKKTADSKSLQIQNKTKKDITVLETKTSSQESYGDNLLTDGDVIESKEKRTLYYEVKENDSFNIKVGLKDEDKTYNFIVVDSDQGEIKKIEVVKNDNGVVLDVTKKDDTTQTISPSKEEKKTDEEKENEEKADETAKTETSSSTDKKEDTTAKTDSNKGSTSTSSSSNKGNTSSSSSSSNKGNSGSSSSSSSSSSSKQDSHTHNWVAQTKVVHHAEVGHNEQVLVQAGYDEQKPIYTQQERSICNVCGADITGNYYAHTEAHLLAGEGGGYHSELVQTLTGYETIHHDAQYTTQYVVDTPAYDETVTTGYKCSCGATK